MALGDLREKRVLDIGCGDGTFSLVLSKLGADVCGQDLNQDRIQEARIRAKKYNNLSSARYITGDVHELKFEDKYFDCVYSSDFVEHIPLGVKKTIKRSTEY